MADLEHIPADESKQIENIVRLTVQHLKRRYQGETAVLRGVHPKDHGCVRAKFTVRKDLDKSLRVGVFAEPGKVYDAWIRFSNAAAVLGRDSTVEVAAGSGEKTIFHGSRGMAIKLLGVAGDSLVPPIGPLTQDFLLINQPVFAFANVEDYEVVSRVLQDNNDDLKPFFKERIRKKPDGSLLDAAAGRAARTFGIINRIRSDKVDGNNGAYQPSPASPVDARYFSAAPFLFGKDRAAKFSAAPVALASGETPDAADENYLRTALLKRLTSECAGDVEFTFQVQLRTASELADKIDTQIEDACVEWKETDFPFVPVATLTIPPQNFDTPERQAVCERLVFTPWHGVQEHKPLGGINRLRLAVYEASAQFRLFPKEPARLPEEGCPS